MKKVFLGIILSVMMLLGSPIANYQMDECSWNGITSEVKDSSANGYNGTANGATTESNTTAGGVLCHVGKFDGSSYVDMGDILSPDSDDWSISVWVKWDGSSGERIIYNKENLYEAKIQNGKFYYAWQPHWNWDGGVSLNANEWTHFVVTYDHNEQKIYKNGVLAYSRTQTGNIGSNTSKLLIAARGNTSPHNYFSGDIDELKIYKYALSDSSISDIYDNENSGKNYDGSSRVCECIVPIADYRMDACGWNGTAGEVKDSSGYNYDGTAQNGASTEKNVTAGGGLCHVGAFDNSLNKEYIKIDNFKQISGNRTITTWIKINNLDSAGRIFADDKNNQNGDYALSYKDPGSGLLRFYIRGLSPVSLDSTTVLQENQWYFIVATFDADNMKKKLYIYDNNDSLVESVSQNVSGTLSQSEGAASIGGERDDGSEASSSTFDGYIDELKIFNKDLNITQIQTIYNNERDEKNYDGASRTCPYCGPFIPIANYQMDECSWNGITSEVKDSSANGYNGTANGATTESNTTAGGVLCHVGKFDGSSYVDMGDILSPDSDDWSISVWVKWDGSSGERIIYNKENLYEAKIQNGKFYYAWQPHWNWDGGVSLNANEWTHFVVTYDHNEQKIYKNGVLAYSRTQTGNIGSNTSKLLIAARGNTSPHNYFSGDIDELKIYKYALSDSSISDIYDNENSGKNYDGSSRVCLSCGGGIFDAWDIFRSINDRNISTKIVGQDFNLTIASLDTNKTNYRDFNGTVCVTIDNNTSKLDFRDQNTTIALFKISRAIKDIRVHISWKKNIDEGCPLSSENNETNSSDNFAIRPEKFTISSVGTLRAGNVFDFNVSANAPDYNTTGVAIEANLTKDCSIKDADFNITTIDFSDGESNNTVKFGDIGVVDINITDKNWASVDGDDTPQNCDANGTYICLDKTNITIIPDHFEINSTMSNVYDTNFTYFSNDLNMSARLDINITAQNKQNQTTQNYNSACYAKDIDINISTNTRADLPIMLYIYKDASDINSTSQSGNIDIVYKDGNFTTDSNGSSKIRLYINYDRNKSVKLNPFDLDIVDINVTDENATFGTTATDENATFYYGRVKTKDISTNKQTISNSLHVEVYSNGKINDFHQESLNWYIMKDDNQQAITDLNDSSKFSDIIDTALDISNLVYDNGTLSFDLINTDYPNALKAYIHIKIPSYLWYSHYEDYNATGDCSKHPCFLYVFNKIGVQNGVQSGDFNGSNIGYDYNATKTKKGIKVFR